MGGQGNAATLGAPPPPSRTLNHSSCRVPSSSHFFFAHTHGRRHEGLFVGPSAALNVAAAVKAARALGPGHTVVTVLCDGGDRYRSKLFSRDWLAAQGLAVGDTDSEAARARITFVK
jgi:hypothetical protein